jgi:hypothetical protein
MVLLLTSASLAAEPRRPQPMDPLSPAERREAEGIAASDTRTRELLGKGKQRLVYVEFVSVKPQDAEPSSKDPKDIGRHAEVVYYRFAGDRGVRALVDLRGRAVVDVAELDGDAVPLTQDDVSEALRLAIKDPELQRVLGATAHTYAVASPGDARAEGQHVVRGLLIHATSDSDPCWQRRCVQMLFRSGDAYLTDNVVVDLTQERVRVEKGLR